MRKSTFLKQPIELLKLKKLNKKGETMTNTNKSCLFMLYLIINYFFMFLIFPTILAALPMSAIFQLILNQALLFGIPSFIFLKIFKSDIKSTLSINPLGLKNTFIIIVISIFIQPFMLLLSAISTLIFPNTVVDAILSQPLEVVIIGMALTPAIFEEFAFRGIIYGTLKSTNTFIKSALISGLFFGIMHFNGQQFLYAFFSGFLFCYIVKRTNSIFSTVLMHFTINASQGVLAFVQSYKSPQKSMAAHAALNTMSDIYYLLLPIIILCLISLPVLYFAIKNLKPLVSDENINTSLLKKERTISFSFVCIILIYLSYIILSLVT